VKFCIDHQNHRTRDIVENFQLAAKFKPKVKLAFFQNEGKDQLLELYMLFCQYKAPACNFYSAEVGG
jgi:hypothetical protein